MQSAESEERCGAVEYDPISTLHCSVHGSNVRKVIENTRHKFVSHKNTGKSFVEALEPPVLVLKVTSEFR